MIPLPKDPELHLETHESSKESVIMDWLGFLLLYFGAPLIIGHLRKRHRHRSLRNAGICMMMSGTFLLVSQWLG